MAMPVSLLNAASHQLFTSQAYVEPLQQPQSWRGMASKYRSPNTYSLKFRSKNAKHNTRKLGVLARVRSVGQRAP